MSQYGCLMGYHVYDYGSSLTYPDSLWQESGYVRLRMLAEQGVVSPTRCTLVSQVTPFAERGRVWSWCNHRIVPTAETWCDQSDPRSLQLASFVMEYNYITVWLADVSILLPNRYVWLGNKLQCDQTLPLSAKGLLRSLYHVTVSAQCQTTLIHNQLQSICV